MTHSVLSVLVPEFRISRPEVCSSRDTSSSHIGPEKRENLYLDNVKAQSRHQNNVFFKNWIGLLAFSNGQLDITRMHLLSAIGMLVTLFFAMSRVFESIKAKFSSLATVVLRFRSILCPSPLLVPLRSLFVSLLEKSLSISSALSGGLSMTYWWSTCPTFSSSCLVSLPLWSHSKHNSWVSLCGCLLLSLGLSHSLW